MPLDLERIKKKAISESVAEQLRMAILRGEVAVGERLPPERQLAPRFGTNRNTLREAIRSLEAQGLVVARQGDGVRVRDFRTDGELSLLPDIIRVSTGDERNRLVADVLTMRRKMAVEVARLGAERATPVAATTLRRLLAEQRSHDGDLLLTLQTDLKVYGAIVEAADSMIATLLFATLTKLTQACLELVPALLYVHPRYLELMAQVVDSIEANDPDGAGTAMATLLEATDEVMVKRLAEFP